MQHWHRNEMKFITFAFVAAVSAGTVIVTNDSYCQNDFPPISGCGEFDLSKYTVAGAFIYGFGPVSFYSEIGSHCDGEQHDVTDAEICIQFTFRPLCLRMPCFL